MHITLSLRLLAAFCLVNLLCITFSFAARFRIKPQVRDTTCDKLKVKPPNYGPDIWKDNTNIRRHGEIMTLILDPPSPEFVEYQWIQVFFSLTSDSLRGPLVDGNEPGEDDGKLTHYPFYWTKDENLHHDTVNGLFFQDHPGVATGDIIWYAEVTLVGVDAHGRLTRIFSYDWGYSYLNDRIKVFKPYRRCSPWPFTLKVIDEYNCNPPPQG